MAFMTLYGPVEALLHMTLKALDFGGSVHGEVIKELPARKTKKSFTFQSHGKINVYFDRAEVIPEGYLKYINAFKDSYVEHMNDYRGIKHG